METPSVQSLARRLENGGVLSCAGVHPAAQPFFSALLHRLFPRRPVVVVTDGLKQQESFHQDLATWLGVGQTPKTEGGSATRSLRSEDSLAEPRLLFYPAWEILPTESRLPHVDVITDRLETLVTLAAGANKQGPAPVVVTSVVALAQRTFRPDWLSQHARTIARGDQLDPLELVEWLEAQGYEPEAQVTTKGELSLRGGILDVFPLTSPWPVRLEFFGDELESLRQFDPFTQKSRDAIDAVAFAPAGELGLLKRPRTSAEETATGAAGSGTATRQPSAEGRDPEQECGSPPLASVLDYLPPEAILVLCGPETLLERAAEYASQVPAGDWFFLPWAEFLRQAGSRGLTVVRVSDEMPFDEVGSTAGPTLAAPLPLRFQSLDAFRPLADRAPEPQIAEAQRREFFAQLHRWLRQGHALHVFCNNDGERQRFSEIWTECGFDAERRGSPAPGPRAQIGTLARGFIFDEAGVVVVTDAEVFGRYKVQRPRRLKSPHAQTSRSALDIDFTDLDDGDFVVHVQHGIGRYLGLQTLPLGSGMKPTLGQGPGTVPGEECLVIEYASADPSQAPPKLYVPVTEAHLVSKYVGAGKARPPLNTLGGTRWAKAKAQAERAVRDIASDLLAIQAARDTQAGHAFGFDTPWQREFESSFIFEETPDQMRAILETKGDMERPKPMDRLICGDVGFGKTEVAIRAAFKSVMDGRQVAVLVPTTVLAQQHFNNFRERMADYPVRVELLSRFRSRREQDRVIRDLGAGAVDIVIGTHRLLQKDIAFKDLGLVVVDEEQRFGVMHKEKFKLLRRMVDVLTLSATPIPRTLYLALSGARDMSTIQTPPHDRLPVETFVVQYDERVIRDAIQRELNRGGQVFFLHNRVMTIDTVASKLRTLLPHARLVVGHGQMHSDELEEVMTTFVNGEADVLLSTTIIESGLDIPNANTIIIDRADRFGLSDLYQLRGRVGRYKHQAYAYLLLPRHAGLLADARKRISAIKQYSTLGSGFKIAMRDLEIRGAGNLLGAEQSGHITAVGFELYCQLLKQSVAGLKGEPIKPRIEVQVRLDFLEIPASPGTQSDSASGAKSLRPTPTPPLSSLASIPYTYIEDARQRIEVYRRLAQATEPEALADLESELRDRFGPPPKGILLLLRIGAIKILAAGRGITSVEVKENKLMLTRNNDFIMIGSHFPRLTRKDTEGKLNEIRKLLLAL